MKGFVTTLTPSKEKVTLVYGVMINTSKDTGEFFVPTLQITGKNLAEVKKQLLRDIDLLFAAAADLE